MSYGVQVALVAAIGAALLLIAFMASNRAISGTRTQRVSKGAAAIFVALGLYAYWPLPEVPAWEEPKTEQERKARDFAHSIVLPDSVPKPVPFNFPAARLKALIPGMGSLSEQYFKHLCDTESSQYIFETVENVDGFLQMRPRRKYSDNQLMEPFLVESAQGLYGSSGQFFDIGISPYTASGGPVYFVQPMIGEYLWLDQIKRDDGNFVHFFREAGVETLGSRVHDFVTGVNGRSVRVPFLIASSERKSSEARFGYTYRGIRRAGDRHLWIAGGELIVLDLRSNKVLAVYREFKLARGKIKRWDLSRWCGSPTVPDSDHLFISRVLKPILNVNRDVPIL